MSALACSTVISWPCAVRACSCAIRTISSTSRLRTSKPHGQRRTFSSVTPSLLPLIPVRIHPHVDLGLAVEELREELADLRRARERLDPLQARPRVDAVERLWVLRVEIHRVREITRALRRVPRRLRYLIVVGLRGRGRFTQPRPDRHRVLHVIPP